MGNVLLFKSLNIICEKSVLLEQFKKCFHVNRKNASLPRRLYSRSELIIISMHRTGIYSLLIAEICKNSVSI